MICKFCGMDSATAEVCSWCGKSLSASTAFSQSVEATGDTHVETAPPVTDAATPPSTAPIQAEASTESFAPSVAPSVVSSAATARKVAPGTPLPASGRPRTPAPAAPIPSSRNAHYNPAPINPVPSNPTPIASSPIATPETASVPTLLQQAETISASKSVSPSVSPSASSSVSASISASVPDFSGGTSGTTIGTGVTPPTSTQPSPAPTSTLDAKQRKAAIDAAMAEAGPAPFMLLLGYLGVFAVILLVMGALCYIKPNLYVAPMLITMFVGTLLLPVMRVTPWVEEDADDLVWFIALTLLFGPLVGFVIYAVVFLARQGGNPSVLGGMAVTALARTVAEAAAHGTAILPHLFQATSPFNGLSHIDAELVKTLLLNWAGFLSIAGWYAATVFHKADE